MKKERAKLGQKYWVIVMGSRGTVIVPMIEKNTYENDGYFKSNNYFLSEDEAIRVLYQIRKILEEANK